MSEAVVATSLLGLVLDETKYYAVATFDCEGKDLPVAFPTEDLAKLVLLALEAKPQAASLGGSLEASQAFVATGATVTPTEDGRIVLALRFGKASEIRVLLNAHDAGALGRTMAAQSEPKGSI